MHPLHVGRTGLRGAAPGGHPDGAPITGVRLGRSGGSVMRARRRLALVLLVPLALAACSGDGGTAPPDVAVVPSAVLARLDAVPRRHPTELGPVFGTLTSAAIRAALGDGVRPLPVPALGAGWSGLVLELESRAPDRTIGTVTLPADTLRSTQVLLWNTTGDVLLGLTARSARLAGADSAFGMIVRLDREDRAWFGRLATVRVTQTASGARCARVADEPRAPQCTLGTWSVAMRAPGFDRVGAAAATGPAIDLPATPVAGVRRVIDLGSVELR
jgi:hypothetical protein